MLVTLQLDSSSQKKQQFITCSRFSWALHLPKRSKNTYFSLVYINNICWDRSQSPEYRIIMKWAFNCNHSGASRATGLFFAFVPSYTYMQTNCNNYLKLYVLSFNLQWLRECVYFFQPLNLTNNNGEYLHLSRVRHSYVRGEMLLLEADGTHCLSSDFNWSMRETLLWKTNTDVERRMTVFVSTQLNESYFSV